MTPKGALKSFLQQYGFYRHRLPWVQNRAKAKIGPQIAGNGGKIGHN